MYHADVVGINPVHWAGDEAAAYDRLESFLSSIRIQHPNKADLAHAEILLRPGQSVGDGSEILEALNHFNGRSGFGYSELGQAAALARSRKGVIIGFGADKDASQFLNWATENAAISGVQGVTPLGVVGESVLVRLPNYREIPYEFVTSIRIMDPFTEDHILRDWLTYLRMGGP
jgi:hypothetical protein